MVDGNSDLKEQILLMRAVIGRKIMEIDSFEERAANTTGDEAERSLNMLEFLRNDITGYKSIIDDFKDGTCDFTGNLWDIASLPEDSLGLYTDFYLPSLAQEDRDEETRAMELKAKYAVEVAKAYVLYIGRMALTDPRVLDLILANEELVSQIGGSILDIPELFDALEKQ
jgi:hypothetical protein